MQKERNTIYYIQNYVEKLYLNIKNMINIFFFFRQKVNQKFPTNPFVTNLITFVNMY